MHASNKHINGYNIQQLVEKSPSLAAFVITTPDGRESIDFFNHNAVKALNQALLIGDYGLDFWDIPTGFLCPPIPGRADYILAIADLLATINNNEIPTGPQIKCIDIGSGASAIYPIIGIQEFGWHFTASEINREAIKNVQLLQKKNQSLSKNLVLLRQNNPNQFFQDVITESHYDISICNPPFFGDLDEAESANKRKLSKLKKQKTRDAHFNFGGKGQELYYQGGETRFIKNMIKESFRFKHTVLYFTTLVSKHSQVKKYRNMLMQMNALDISVLEMQQGQKKSRILVWSFLTPNQRKAWAKLHWRKKG